MRNTRWFSVPVLIGTTLVLSGGEYVAGNDPPGSSEPTFTIFLPDRVKLRIREIETALEEAQANEWAGYYQSYSEGDHFWWTPDAGFAFAFADPCVTDMPITYIGSAKVDGHWLVLDMREEISDLASRHIADRFAVVRWDQRRYLIPESRIVDFCNLVNSGRPAYGSGGFLVRGMVRRELPEGRPQLPPEWREYLLVDPIECEVCDVRVTTQRMGMELEWERFRIELRVNAGRQEGLLPGMLLRRADGPHFDNFRVESVTDQSAVAVLEYARQIPRGLAVGTPLSTQRFSHSTR